jgi:hypothetical protein
VFVPVVVRFEGLWTLCDSIPAVLVHYIQVCLSSLETHFDALKQLATSSV